MMGVRIVIAVSRLSYMSIRELSASLLDAMSISPASGDWQIRLIDKVPHPYHVSSAAVPRANQTDMGNMELM